MREGAGAHLWPTRARKWTVHLFIILSLCIIVLVLLKPDLLVHEEVSCHFSAEEERETQYVPRGELRPAQPMAEPPPCRCPREIYRNTLDPLIPLTPGWIRLTSLKLPAPVLLFPIVKQMLPSILFPKVVELISTKPLQKPHAYPQSCLRDALPFPNRT